MMFSFSHLHTLVLIFNLETAQVSTRRDKISGIQLFATEIAIIIFSDTYRIYRTVR